MSYFISLYSQQVCKYKYKSVESLGIYIQMVPVAKFKITTMPLDLIFEQIQYRHPFK